MSDQAEHHDQYIPAHLGRQSSDPVSTVDRIPWHGAPIEVVLECGEFTSLCPVTRQPDFGTLTVRFAPRNFLVETKSLKLYLTGYRDRGIFSEVLVDAIADDLYRQLEPRWLEVTGRFNSRGGISVQATSRRPTESAPEAPPS